MLEQQRLFRLEFEEHFAVQSDAEPGTDEQTGEDAVETGDSEGADDSVAADMDACVAAGSRFSVYDDIRQKLMERGIPADEIAFIHDANTDIRKGKLFSDMQAGRVRILLGSTAKMGAGMNVQKPAIWNSATGASSARGICFTNATQINSP